MRRVLPISAVLAIVACATPPVFPPVDPPLEWPRSGDPARVRYVGAISSDADLKRPRSLWRRVRDLVAGAEPPAAIRSAHGVAVTDTDVLFVADPEAHVVHRFDLEGRNYRALAEISANRKLVMPIGLSLRGRELLVADRALALVAVLSTAGEPLSTFGETTLQSPIGIAVGRSGRTFVADVEAHHIAVFSPEGDAMTPIGSRGVEPGRFNFPTHVACDERERLYVSDSLNARVQVFDRDGTFVRALGKKGDFPGDFSQPKGLACDAEGRLYVVDSHFENVQIFSARGTLLLALGSEGRGPGEFWLPVGICTDRKSRFWVADSFNHRVQVFQRLLADEGSAAP